MKRIQEKVRKCINVRCVVTSSVWERLVSVENVFSENAVDWLCAQDVITNFLDSRKLVPHSSG